MTAEEYIKDFTRGCSNELENGEFEYWLTPWQAEAACNLKKEETIEKAWKWIKSNICYDENGDCNMEWVVMFMDDDEMVENFKKFMED